MTIKELLNGKPLLYYIQNKSLKSVIHKIHWLVLTIVQNGIGNTCVWRLFSPPDLKVVPYFAITMYNTNIIALYQKNSPEKK